MLDSLVQIYTPRNTQVPQYDIFCNGINERVTFLWGIKVHKDIEGQTLTPAEIFSLGPIDRVVLTFEGMNTGKLYRTGVLDLWQLTPGAKLDWYEDDNYAIFGSRKLYKAFFKRLNDAQLDSSTYMRILGTIGLLSYHPSRWRRVIAKIRGIGVIDDYVSRRRKKISEEQLELLSRIKEYLIQAQEDIGTRASQRML